jgi:hypothetical protein
MDLRNVLWIILLCFFVTLSEGARLALARPPYAEADDFFEKKVRPLLHEHCLKCHSGQKPKGGLALVSRSSVLTGGSEGPAAVSDKPSESLLIAAVRYNAALKMPPKKKLSDQDIATLVRWVEMGVPWPQTKSQPTVSPKSHPEFAITQDQRRFWAFQKLRAVRTPEVNDTRWPHTGADRFVLAGLESKVLRPAPMADKRTLIRRATFDLIGLPPTLQEVDAFVNDPSPDAYNKVIDRLLASPHYGERWGRHWLDLARYTDSFDARITTGPGSEMDVTEAWRYRDWVVDAWNRDLPYNEFIVQQIAGDLWPTPDSGGLNKEGIIATGFLAIGNWGGGDADKEKLLTDIVDDQVDVVSRTFLGLTVACARCHDHKFDPISTADYYGLAGIFFSTHILPNVGPKTNGPPMLRIPLSGTELEKVKQTPRSTNAKNENPPAIPVAHGAQEGGVPDSPHAGVHDVRVHVRGSYSRLGVVVPRRFPTILAGEHQPPITSESGRLPLAQWIASPDNPLTARVMANRLWQYHFGEGIVRTPSNFGKMGEPPTNPELLDFLAGELIRSGWSLKAMHRLIMLSATYRQSSIPPDDNRRLDPDNRLFSRMNRRRLEAEAVRDNLLAVSGALDKTMGGRATRDFFSPRRTLYQMTIRSDRTGFGPLFDAADPTSAAEKRTVSTVAPQALLLLNHPFVLGRSKALASRICKSHQNETARIRTAYVALYGRLPSAEEVRLGLEFLNAHEPARKEAWAEYCHVLVCANEFVYVD